jgi:hypothetical protein
MQAETSVDHSQDKKTAKENILIFSMIMVMLDDKFFEQWLDNQAQKIMEQFDYVGNWETNEKLTGWLIESTCKTGSCIMRKTGPGLVLCEIKLFSVFYLKTG